MWGTETCRARLSPVCWLVPGVPGIIGSGTRGRRRGKVERDGEHGINLGFGKDELCDGASAWEKQREYG